MKKYISIAAIILTVLIFSVLVFSVIYVNEDRVAAYLSDALGEDITVEVQSASLNPLSRTLSLEDIRIQSADGDNFTEIFTSREIKLEKIRIIETLRGTVSIGSVVIDSFFVDLSGMQKINSGENQTGSSGPVAFDTFELNNGRVHFRSGDDDHGKLQGVNLYARPLSYQPECNDCTRLSILSNTELDIENIEFTILDERYELKADSLTLSESDSNFQIKNISLETLLPEDKFFESFEFRTELFLVDIHVLNIDQIDYSNLRENGDFSASVVSLDSLDLHITYDKSLERGPDGGESPMPLDVLNRMPFGVTVDSLLINNANIRYSEFAEDGERPGTILFANTNAVVKNIQSFSDEPTVFTAQSFLEEYGELQTEFKMTMEESGQKTEVTGTLGSFDVTRLNNIFLDLEGIHIKDGIIHGLHFDFSMTEMRAAGYITIHYEHLSLELVDKVDHNRSLSDRLSGLFMDQIVIRATSVHNGKEGRTGQIDKEREPERGFFNYLWKSLRSGILDVVKRM